MGQLSSELLLKQPDTLSPIEHMQEQLTDYDKNLFECLEAAKKQYMHDFYVIVITKKEPLMPNVLRNYFYARQSCPTPDYDQTVYSYDCHADSINFLWVIPSRDTCQLMIANKEKIVPEEYGLLEFVLKFADGTLFKECKKLNGEQENSPLLAN